MTEEIFDDMINSSDPVPILKKFESNSVTDQTSNFEKQIKGLQKTLDEIEDENCDLRFKLDKSFEENKELCKELNDLKNDLFKKNLTDKKMFNDQKWNVRSNPEFETSTKPTLVYSDCPEYLPNIYEKGETSGILKKNSSLKKKTNKVSFHVSDLSKGVCKGEWRKKDSDKKACKDFVEKDCIVSNSVDLTCLSLWFVDSGCSRHMTGYKHLLHNFVEEPAGIVSFANSELQGFIRGYGSLKNGIVTIKKVLYVEGLDHNLFSTSHFCDSMYQNFKAIDKLARQGIVKGLPEMSFEKDSLCPACEMGKMKQSSHKSKTESSCSTPLELIHMDLCGPMRTQSINGKKYILVMIDEYSRCYILNDYDNLGKFDKKDDEGYFVGYSLRF
ncbi:hypothetical protein L6452_34905 [Arctium lappa]|uniref:Uncharacterized protein n=1 Tax=Arctium lappa TaxID=4217 RepID=A0ACB8YKP6_ARCLA|nr:hypothetical protein L6452_34905 [Arctium lappa]